MHEHTADTVRLKAKHLEKNTFDGGDLDENVSNLFDDVKSKRTTT